MKPIEYIGAAPVKKKKRSIFGGWVIVTMALAMIGTFIWPLFLKAQGDLTSDSNTREALHDLRADGRFGAMLAAGALERTLGKVEYDGAYYQIDFPNGDIDPGKGKAEDLIVRSFRAVGIDLQKDLHEDISGNYKAYPQIFNARSPDTNIDHRRVQNLQRFFLRQGQRLAVSSSPHDFAEGDIVVWNLLSGDKHIGIVVRGPGAKKTEKWVVHNLGDGPVWEDALFSYHIDGHYRYGE